LRLFPVFSFGAARLAKWRSVRKNSSKKKIVSNPLEFMIYDESAFAWGRDFKIASVRALGDKSVIT